jgi:hypothetical protein
MGTCASSIALAWLLSQDASAFAGGDEPVASPVAPKPSHFAPRAKRVLQIFCPGAVSHLDTFDYKPELIKRHGQPMPGEKIVTFQGGNGDLMKSPWGWSQRGQSGKWMSDLLPHLAGCADDLCFVHSLTAKSNTHGPAMLQMNTGFVTEGFPSMGAWLGFALGTENQNLPAYVAIPDTRGFPPNGPANWSNGFLPASYQGVAFNTDRPIPNIAPPPGSSKAAEKDLRTFLDQINRDDAANHPGQSDLAARIASYALAARMQLSAPEVSDLSAEPQSIHRQYGTDSGNPLKAAYARNCILSRRLLERGVRFVQLFCGAQASGVDGLLNWDAHRTLKEDYDRHGAVFDQPTAALINDLKQRGMLQDTLVIWTTEFGRMPTHQANSLGRDHNPFGFTAFLAGGGSRAGHSHGATDDFGYKAVVDECSIYDFHATILHLLGLNHEKLTFYHNGSRRRLTDVHGKVISGLIG